MAKRITTDTEYWQLKDDCEKAYAASEKETDKKRRKELLSTVKENQKLLADYAKRKKKDTVLPCQLIDKVEKIPNQILTVPLTAQSIANALQNDEFVEKYVSSKTNPFALISETCMYDDSVSWADMDELFGSLHQINSSLIIQ